MNFSTARTLTAPVAAAAVRPLSRWAKAMAAALGQRPAAIHGSLTQAQAHRLSQGATLVIDDARGQMVVCQSGCAWITYDCDPVDRFVEAGQSHLPCSASRMLVHAVSDVQLTITPVEAA
jgi:hypothetical protein